MFLKPSQCLLIPDDTNNTLQNQPIFLKGLEKSCKDKEIQLYLLIPGITYMIRTPYTYRYVFHQGEQTLMRVNLEVGFG